MMGFIPGRKQFIDRFFLQYKKNTISEKSKPKKRKQSDCEKM
jgi:hypothetical protein